MGFCIRITRYYFGHPNFNLSIVGFFYIYLGSRLLATTTSSGTQYHHPDALGTRLITNANDLSVSEQVNLPFGTSFDSWSSGTASNRRFTSYDRSQVSHLDYAINRFYSSGQGRFTQPDPIGMKSVSLENPQSLNQYAYCINDPINHTDPDGQFFGWLKRLFHRIGTFLSAVAAAVSTVLNNKWLNLALTIVGFAIGLPGVANFLGKALTQIIKVTLSVISKIKSIVSEIQIAGEVLQGNFRELGLGLVGSLPAIVEDSVTQGILKNLGALRADGTMDFKAAFKNFSIRKFINGAWNGLTDGLSKISHIFHRSLKDFFILAFGNYCGAGYGGFGPPRSDPVPQNGAPTSEGDALCKRHDKRYYDSINNPYIIDSNAYRLSADLQFLGGVVFANFGFHLVDRALGLRAGNGTGDAYRFVAIPAFAGLILGRAWKY